MATIVDMKRAPSNTLVVPVVTGLCADEWLLTDPLEGLLAQPPPDLAPALVIQFRQPPPRLERRQLPKTGHEGGRIESAAHQEPSAMPAAISWMPAWCMNSSAACVAAAVTHHAVPGAEAS
jgi:hypothetical protein